jgi:hypothetical protein
MKPVVGSAAVPAVPAGRVKVAGTESETVPLTVVTGSKA